MSTVQTSAPAGEPDLFGGAAPAVERQAELVIEVEGVLMHAAEVRTKVVGEDQHPVPVLCLDLRPLSGLKRTIHVEQVFTEATRKAAETKAADLKRGTRVTFITGLADMRTTFPHVRSVKATPSH